MSRNKFDNIANLQPGRYDYKIKVRVIRLWRGATISGEEFKSLNILLLDAEVVTSFSYNILTYEILSSFNNCKLFLQKTRIHAFVPTSCAEDLYPNLKVGNVYSIKNFTMQLYKPTKIFRC